jgi:endo-1,4-beta-xylanase
MKFKYFMLIFGGMCLATVIVFSWGCQNQPTAPAVAGDAEQITVSPKMRGYQSGTHDGYFWSLWTSDGLSGSVNYSNGSGGNYSVSWNCNGNFTCGKGWSSGSKTRVVGYNCGSYSQNGGGGSFAYYGWCRNPLMEYYVNEKWPGSRPTSGSSLRTLSSDGGTYNVYTAWRSNAPSIDGTQSFRQIFSTRTSQNSTGSNHTITFANHANAWAAAGYGLGNDMSPAAILLTEAWGQSSGYCNATVWNAGSSSGGGSTTTTTSGGGGGGGSCTLTLRARSTDGQGKVRLVVGGKTVGDWTLGTGMSDKSVTLWSSKGDCYVEFYNDASGRDVQVDYLKVCGSTRQAESQSYNTAVWQNGSCGGSNSEWMHCNGIIGFGNVSY